MMKDDKKRESDEEQTTAENEEINQEENETEVGDIETDAAECEDQNETAGDDESEIFDEDDIQKELDELKAELEKAKAEAAEYKDKWMRTYADMENLRKRTAIEKQDSLKYANFNIISDLLTILDNFQLAIEAGEKEPFDKDNYVNGIKMIETQFIDLLFKKYGVVKYGEAGEAFDPNIHQAMMMEEGDYEKDELAMVFRSGYKLHDRVVRPAQVKVGKPAANKEQ
jgi:molecular chaperone GrpE